MGSVAVAEANKAAKAVFWIVLVVGLAVVCSPVFGHAGNLFDDPFAARSETKTVVNEDESGRVTSRVITTQPDTSSLPERALGAGALLFVRLAVVGLGAFLAAGFTQKVLKNDYSIKLGGLELAREQVADKAGESIEQLIGVVAQLRSDHEALKAGAKEQLGETGKLVNDLADAMRQLDQEIRDLQRKRRPT